MFLIYKGIRKKYFHSHFDFFWQHNFTFFASCSAFLKRKAKNKEFVMQGNHHMSPIFHIFLWFSLHYLHFEVSSNKIYLTITIYRSRSTCRLVNVCSRSKVTYHVVRSFSWRKQGALPPTVTALCVSVSSNNKAMQQEIEVQFWCRVQDLLVPENTIS